MARRRVPVLLDTNAILEAHRVGGWRALANGYQLETVEECVTETQTGALKRPSDERIDVKSLRASLKMVHKVGDVELEVLQENLGEIRLDDGELELWAHALGRDDVWVMCGPDTSSMHAGVRLGFRDRLIPLERLFKDIGYRPKTRLRENYTASWLRKIIDELVQRETFSDP